MSAAAQQDEVTAQANGCLPILRAVLQLLACPLLLLVDCVGLVVALQSRAHILDNSRAQMCMQVQPTSLHLKMYSLRTTLIGKVLGATA